MTSDAFWEVFKDTGDPLCWLMGREADEQRSAPTAEQDIGGAAPPA